MSHDSKERARQVHSWANECSKLRGQNKRLSNTLAQHEKTIKSQHSRLTSLTGLHLFGKDCRFQPETDNHDEPQTNWRLSALPFVGPSSGDGFSLLRLLQVRVVALEVGTQEKGMWVVAAV